MANLRTKQLKTVFKSIVADYARDKPVDLTKADFKAAAQAMANWLDANAVSLNKALPVAFRTKASPAMKAALLSSVATTKFRG